MQPNDASELDKSTQSHDASELDKSTQSHDVSELDKSTQSHDASELDKSTQSHDASELDKSTQSHDVSELDKSTQSHDASELDKSTQSHDASELDKSTQSHDVSELDKSTQSHDASELDKSTQSHDASELDKSTQSHDASELDKSTQSHDASELDKSTQSHDASELDKSTQSHDASELDKSTQSHDASELDKSTQSHDASELDKSTQSHDASELDKSTQSHDASELDKLTQLHDASELDKSTQSHDASNEMGIKDRILNFLKRKKLKVFFFFLFILSLVAIILNYIKLDTIEAVVEIRVDRFEFEYDISKNNIGIHNKRKRPPMLPEKIKNLEIRNFEKVSFSKIKVKTYNGDTCAFKGNDFTVYPDNLNPQISLTNPYFNNMLFPKEKSTIAISNYDNDITWDIRNGVGMLMGNIQINKNTVINMWDVSVDQENKNCSNIKNIEMNSLDETISKVQSKNIKFLLKDIPKNFAYEDEDFFISNPKFITKADKNKSSIIDTGSIILQEKKWYCNYKKNINIDKDNFLYIENIKEVKVINATFDSIGINLKIHGEFSEIKKGNDAKYSNSEMPSYLDLFSNSILALIIIPAILTLLSYLEAFRGIFGFLK